MEKSCGTLFLRWPAAFQAGSKVAGGKGWNLGRLDRYGFTVPAGGVLGAAAYQDFVEKNHLFESIETVKQTVTVDNIWQKGIDEGLFSLREKIKNGCISPYIREELILKLTNIGILEKPVAVRSSATVEDTDGASFAGIHQSFLNVRGIENILCAIKECYASLWTPQALAYRRKMKIREDEVIPAVVIMEMVEATAAGVGFTCDPWTGREDVLVIQANFGLGESVVSGTVEPDEYRLDSECEITEKRVGRKKGKSVAGEKGGTKFVEFTKASTSQVLRDEDIRQLGLLIQRVYEALGLDGQHQDIEWVFDGRNFSLVQARPVTALARYIYAEIKHQPDIWSNANFRDGIPMVQSTLNWSLMREDLNLMLNAPAKAMGYPGLPGLQHVRLYQGRAYFNLSLQQWLWHDTLGVAPRDVNENYGGHQPEIEIKDRKSHDKKHFIKGKYLLKLILTGQKSAKKAKKSFVKIDQFTKALLKEKLGNLTESQLSNKVAEIRNASMDFALVFIFCANASMKPLEKALDKSFPGKGKAMATALMAGKGDITSAQHGYRLLEMAEIARGDNAARRFFSGDPFDPLEWEKELPEKSPFKQSFRDFLIEFGHRGVYEMDIINPRWREDPSYLLEFIRRTLETADLHRIKAGQMEKTGRLWQEVKRKVPIHRRIFIHYMRQQVIKSSEIREMAKSVFIKLFESERLVFQEIGRRLAGRGILPEPDDIFHCTYREVVSILNGNWDGKGLNLLACDRKVWRKEMERLPAPDVIINEAPEFAEAVIGSAGNALTGLGVAAGKASGTARFIHHPGEGDKLQNEEVLVAPSTDPGWTPLFLKASAIVMETGGFLSHGAIVAREYGIPAVVNIPGVRKMIKDSQLITVDGDEGKVYL